MMLKKASLVTTIFFAMVSAFSNTVVNAQSVANDPVIAGFRSFDLNGDSFVRPNEAVAYLAMIFRSMDVNSDDTVSLDEFKKFSLGFLAIAEQNGKADQYQKAREIIFKRWSNGKASMTISTMTASVRREFAKVGGEKPGPDLRLDLEQFRRVQFLQEMSASVK